MERYMMIHDNKNNGKTTKKIALRTRKGDNQVKTTKKKRNRRNTKEHKDKLTGTNNKLRNHRERAKQESRATQGHYKQTINCTEGAQEN